MRFRACCSGGVYAFSGPATDDPNRFVGWPVDGLVRLNNMCGGRDGLVPPAGTVAESETSDKGGDHHQRHVQEVHMVVALSGSISVSPAPTRSRWSMRRAGCWPVVVAGRGWTA